MASTLYFPRSRSMTRYFSFPSFQPLTENFAIAPRSSANVQLRCCVLRLRLLGLARTSLRSRHISRDDFPFFSSLPLDRTSDFFPRQTEAGSDLSICLSALMPLLDDLYQLFYLPVLSCHAKTSCRSFYSTTVGGFFLLSVCLGTVQCFQGYFVVEPRG